MFSQDDVVASAGISNPSYGADEGSTMSISVKTSPRAVEGLSITIFTILKIKSNQINTVNGAKRVLKYSLQAQHPPTRSKLNQSIMMILQCQKKRLYLKIKC